MAKVKEVINGKSVDNIEAKIKKLQEQKSKLEAEQLMKLGRLTLGFAKNGFQDFEKFQVEIRRICE
jgi:hypothetical protein